jgi:hypothetical protein
MATAINIMQSWLDKAVELRTDMLQSEVKFFIFLIEGERGACPWRGQYSSFEQLLSSTNLCAPGRYSAFRDAFNHTNGNVQSQSDTLGVVGVIEAGRIEDPVDRTTFVSRIVEGTKNQGCPLSSRRIKEIGEQIQPKKRPARHPKDKSYEQLLKENEKLRAENEQLKKENAKLKEKLKSRK